MKKSKINENVIFINQKYLNYLPIKHTSQSKNILLFICTQKHNNFVIPHLIINRNNNNNNTINLILFDTYYKIWYSII